jgi:HEAT repeat protein
MVDSLVNIPGRDRSLDVRFAALVGALVVGLAGFSSNAVAQTNGQQDDPNLPSTSPEDNEDGKSLREGVLYLLSGYHFQPSREDLDELADQEAIVDELKSIVDDDSLRPSLRGRAVDTLALYETDEVVAFLDGLIEPSEAEQSDEKPRVVEMLRNRAILSYAEMRDDQQVVDRLEGLLDADDRQLRLTVVSALGQHAGQPGTERLKAYAGQVDDEIVSGKIADYVETEGLPKSED